MSTKDIFISYKAEEFDQANWVKERLESQGISCWMAPLSIIGGASYASEIPKAIRECKIFVLILSEKVQTSKWVPRELDQAINDEKVIMPFMIENCPLNDAFRFYLTNVQRYYGYDGMEAAMEKMVSEMKAILGIEEEEEQEDAVVKEEKSTESVETSGVDSDKISKKKQKEKKVKKEKDPAKKKNTKKVLGIIGGALVAAVAIFFLINTLSHVTIAGVKFKKADYRIKIEDATLTHSDINNLKKFKKIDYIEFVRCDIQPVDISAITDCELLYRLVLEDCNLSLTQMQSLDFSEQAYLYELNLSGNPALGDFSYLKGIETLSNGLDYLYLDNTGLKELSFAEQFTNLEALSVSDNQLTDLEPLTGCIYMTQLYIGGNEIASLDGLENMTQLTTVDIHDNQISDISALSKSLSTLREVHMEQNQISDISSLAGATQLGYISADHNQITSLEVLGSMPALKVLFASHNQLTSMEGVGGHSELMYVDLSDNQITSMECSVPFCLDSEYYSYLDLSNNQISELMLQDVTKLSHLFIQGNPIENLSSVVHIQGSMLAFDYSESIDWNLLVDDMWSYYWITGVPLDKQVFLKDILNVEFVDETQLMEEEARFKEEDVYFY